MDPVYNCEGRGANEIGALRYKDNETDIYSCSYGTKENVGFPSKREYIEEALAEGVSKVNIFRAICFVPTEAFYSAVFYTDILQKCCQTAV